jgi:hypothetical protein
MTPHPAAPPRPATPMYFVGALVLVGVLGYFLFSAANTMGLQPSVVPARVVQTGYRAAGQTYVTQIVNNRPLVVPQAVPESWYVDVEVDGETATAAIDRALHERLRPGDQVVATIVRTRLTGAMQVIDVQSSRPGFGGQE